VKIVSDDELPFEALQKAVGLPLTETEERYLRWLARYDIETIATFIGLFERIRKENQ
jgi:hypothetical protein